jgi:hypothetical protein
MPSARPTCPMTRNPGRTQSVGNPQTRHFRHPGEEVVVHAESTSALTVRVNPVALMAWGATERRAAWWRAVVTSRSRSFATTPGRRGLWLLNGPPWRLVRRCCVCHEFGA